MEISTELPLRRTSDAMKLMGVEAARGLAAMLVVLAHVSNLLPCYFSVLPFGGVFGFGLSGVDFFFVISGFIILYIHNGEIGLPAASAGYVRKRFLRIFPTYWAVMALFMSLWTFNPLRDPLDALTNLLLVPIPDHPPILLVSWSLRNEILFYTLFATLFFNRYLGIAVLGAWGTLCVVNLATGVLDVFPASFLFGPFNIEFFFGMLVAFLVRRWRPVLPRTCIVVGLLIFFANGIHEAWGRSVHQEVWPGHHLTYAAGAAIAVYGLVCAETTGRLPRLPRWVIALGGASYSIYLMHTLVIVLALYSMQSALPAGITLAHETSLIIPAFVTTVLAAALAGWYFSRLVEQPLLAWCRRPRRAALG